ncbi:MAG: hypothetical protein WAV02_22745 [Stellaceae bacterium]
MVSRTHNPAQSRLPTRRNPLGTYTPTSFSQPSRWRFGRHRRAAYLGRITGEPTAWQLATIPTLISLEWSSLVAEAAHTDLAAARESRESRRLFQRLLADFERSLIAPPHKLTPQEALAAIHSPPRAA